jgi:four helix bundle protein
VVTFKRFEDIQAWQKARELSVNIYRISGNNDFSRDFELRGQIRRSATSIMSTIAEGQGRRTDRDFAHFLNISLGSVAETKSHMYLAIDLGYVSEVQFNEVYEKLDEIGKMVFSLMAHLRNSQTSTSSLTSQTF